MTDDWRLQAVCRGMPQSVFYPPGKHPDYLEAARVCAVCPGHVKDACLADALSMERAAGVCHGYRAGLSPEQRARVVKR